MAELVSVLGMTHHPFYLGLSQAPPEARPPFLDVDAWIAKVERLRSDLAASKPDVLIMVGNDHFHQFFLDNMPAFLVGKMGTYDGIFYNEVREFGLPRCVVRGDPTLSQHVLDGGLARGIDFSFSNELKLDHSLVMPLYMVRPELDLPVVPILANCMAPPLPPAARFHQVGQALRQVIEEFPSDARVGVIASSHFSLELGGPRQFGHTGPDPEFDERALDWIRRGDAKAAIGGATPNALTAVGNASHAFMTLILAMGVVDDAEPTYAEGLQVLTTMEGFIFWDKEAIR
jgi:protocatechuate 4,5-dioxygenase, beta chain